MLKGIKQPNLTTKTTKLPGTELPTVRHSSDLTGNKDVGNVVRNMTSAFKNPLMGQKSVLTNSKNHLGNMVKTSLPSIKTGFEPKKIQESSGMRKALLVETGNLFFAGTKSPNGNIGIPGLPNLSECAKNGTCSGKSDGTNGTKTITETTKLRNVIDHGMDPNGSGTIVHSGSKDLGSGTKKEQTTAIKDTVAAPRKPLKNETLGIQNMPQKKKNQGLMFNSKMNTAQRNTQERNQR